MILRVYEEIPPNDGSIKAVVATPFKKNDAPGVVVWRKMSKWRLILLLLKAAWLTLTKG